MSLKERHRVTGHRHPRRVIVIIHDSGSLTYRNSAGTRRAYVFLFYQDSAGKANGDCHEEPYSARPRHCATAGRWSCSSRSKRRAAQDRARAQVWLSTHRHTRKDLRLFQINLPATQAVRPNNENSTKLSKRRASVEKQHTFALCPPSEIAILSRPREKRHAVDTYSLKLGTPSLTHSNLLCQYCQVLYGNISEGVLTFAFYSVHC